MRRTVQICLPGSRLLATLVAGFVIAAPVVARAQPVTLSDERVVFAVAASPDAERGHTSGPVRLSPDGQSLLYADPPGHDTIEQLKQLVIVRLASLAEGKQRVEFRPGLGRSTGRDLWDLFVVNPFSPDGKLFVSPDFNAPAQRGHVQQRPILVCQLGTGKVARTRIAANLHTAAIDHTGKLLLDMDGQSYSLVTGQPARRFGYAGRVVATSPVAPVVCVDTGVEGRPGPRHVNAWNLRDDKLLARLPHNEKFDYSTYAEPAWTSDGTYVYFGDAVGDQFPEEREVDRSWFVTRVWNVKTGRVVGEPLPWTRWRRPGPRAGTMILSTEFDGSTDEPRQFLHDVATGATADLPVHVLDAGGGKVAYVKTIDGKPHLCVATLVWGAGPATKPVRSSR